MKHLHLPSLVFGLISGLLILFVYKGGVLLFGSSSSGTGSAQNNASAGRNFDRTTQRGYRQGRSGSGTLFGSGATASGMLLRHARNGSGTILSSPPGQSSLPVSQ